MDLEDQLNFVPFRSRGDETAPFRDRDRSGAAGLLEHALDELLDERARGYVGAVDPDHVLLAPPGVDESLLYGQNDRDMFVNQFIGHSSEEQERDPTIVKVTILLMGRDCSGDGVTGDGGYGDITGDKIFTGEVTG